MITYEEMKKNIKILLVDDDEDYLQVTLSYFKLRGYDIKIAKSGNEALELVENNQFHILLIDYFMPDMTGKELISKIREKNKETIIILQTGFAGQLPPTESMKNLDIQNYYDKSEGIEKLNLNIISAIKTFIWQNEILLKDYKNYAITNLITSIVNEVKSSLLSLSAGIEYSNILIKESETKKEENKEEIEERNKKIQKYYNSNKTYLDKVDMMLTAVVNQLSEENTEDIYKDSEIIDLIQLILKNKLKLNGVELEEKKLLKEDSYLKGHVNDVIFIICEIISEIIKVIIKENEQENDRKISFVFTEDDFSYIFKIENKIISKIQKEKIYIFKNITMLLENTEFLMDENVIAIKINK